MLTLDLPLEQSVPVEDLLGQSRAVELIDDAVCENCRGRGLTKAMQMIQVCLRTLLSPISLTLKGPRSACLALQQINLHFLWRTKESLSSAIWDGT